MHEKNYSIYIISDKTISSYQTILKITQLEKVRFIKMNELKLTLVELLSLFLNTVFAFYTYALCNDLLNELYNVKKLFKVPKIQDF